MSSSDVSCQLGFSGRLRPLLRIGMAMGVLSCVVGQAAAVDPDWSAMPLATHSTLQGVTTNGSPTFSTSQFPIRMIGVVINNYDEMLDNTANYLSTEETGNMSNMGGQWQIFFQSVDLADPAGSCLWMGQNLAIRHGGDDGYSYYDEEWNDEVARVSCYGDLREGCLIEVRARAGLPYAGKFNINEFHDNDPAYDFDIIILDQDYGLPDPIQITMDDIMDPTGTFLFGSSPRSGAEVYQGRLVTLEGVTIVNSDNWATYGEITVSDGERDFRVRLGYNEAFAAATLPTGTLDITGVFDQDKFGTPMTSGYLMWVTRPDGFSPHDPLLGDANGDGVVGDADATILASHWRATSGMSWFDGDFNNDGMVNEKDASILASHWGQGVAENATVPEPGATAMLLLGGLVLLGTRFSSRWRKRLPGEWW